MFVMKPKDKTKLDEAIDHALDELIGFDVTDNEYAKHLAQVERLYSLKQQTKPERVSRDTLAIVLGNLAGIVVIVGHERAHVVTSKALGFILRAR